MTRPGGSQVLAWAAALVMLGGAVILERRGVPASAPAATASPPRDAALARCRAAGAAALEDPACRQAWDGARARFFGRGRS